MIFPPSTKHSIWRLNCFGRRELSWFFTRFQNHNRFTPFLTICQALINLLAHNGKHVCQIYLWEWQNLRQHKYLNHVWILKRGSIVNDWVIFHWAWENIMKRSRIFLVTWSSESMTHYDKCGFQIIRQQFLNKFLGKFFFLLFHVLRN